VAARWAAPLATIDRRFGVPASIVLAAWGMEADFAQPNQTQDVVRSLATLIWARAGDASSRSEFVDALKILQIRDEPRAELTGSWAGAMGMPQFMPSTYLRFATSYRGDAPADIWRSAPDALCSIANFLRGSGWRPGLPWGVEVHAPEAFRWEALRAPFARWSALGFRAVGKRALPAAGDGSLFAPAGAKGPVFLLSDNFWVLKDYDNSDSYALALGLLADGLDGRPGPSVEWPRDARLLPLALRARAQADLKRLGFYDGAADGKVGPATREAVHLFQRSASLSPADGFLSQMVAATAERAVRQR
jgi:lytic murein transglycosylase